MPLIKGGSVNYGNGNALSIALHIFSKFPRSVLRRTPACKKFKPVSELHWNQETGPSTSDNPVRAACPCRRMGFRGPRKPTGFSFN